MNLILCGMMGCGKTTVGRALAALSGKICCDTDDEIVEKYGRIADIFARHGEEYFRNLETETVRALAKRDGLVIATGGGVVLKRENVELLKKSGKLVYLRAKKETLLARLQADQERPLLRSEKGLSQRLDELLKARAAIYEDASDYVVDVDGKAPKEIAAEIVALTEK